MTIAGKTAARKILRARRHSFVAGLDDQRETEQAAIATRIAPHLANHQVVAAYVAIGSEAGLSSLLVDARRRGIATALPHVTAPGSPMRFLRWQAGEPLDLGPFGLLQPPATAEPVVPDLILAPLLGFDRSGGRLGQGAGFYDRAFAANLLARRIGIAWSVQEMPALPLDAWDMPLHAVVTEREWIEINPDQAGASRSASSSSSR